MTKPEIMPARLIRTCRRVNVFLGCHSFDVLSERGPLPSDTDTTREGNRHVETSDFMPSFLAAIGLECEFQRFHAPNLSASRRVEIEQWTETVLLLKKDDSGGFQACGFTGHSC